MHFYLYFYMYSFSFSSKERSMEGLWEAISDGYPQFAPAREQKQTLSLLLAAKLMAKISILGGKNIERRLK